MFSKKLFIEKRENINFFWKGNKMKGGYEDALQSGRDRYTNCSMNNREVINDNNLGSMSEKKEFKFKINLRT